MDMQWTPPLQAQYYLSHAVLSATTLRIILSIASKKSQQKMMSKS